MTARPSSRTAIQTPVSVAALFNEMVTEYDEIRDLWYAWLCSRLHLRILYHLSRTRPATIRECLDVGCGTGFQSLMLAMCGLDVTGIDIAADLVGLAQRKCPQDYCDDRDLFKSPFRFTRRYGRRIRSLAQSLRGSREVGGTRYAVASATSIPFEDRTFDLVNCCGSTLSFIDEYRVVLTETARVLRPGGLLILEVENKYAPDLVWPIIDCCLRGAIGYGQTWEESRRNLFSKRAEHVRTRFPFSTHAGEVEMNIWLFSSSELRRELEEHGFDVLRLEAIHCITNLIPSVALDSPNPSLLLKAAFTTLASLEACVASWPRIRTWGCSTLLFCRRR